MSHANNFTPLRLGLALLVVLGHFQLLTGIASPPFPFNYSSVAVDAFFVVSGYLVTASFDRDPNLRRFYLRRLFRIYPLYILVVLAQTLLLSSLAPGGLAANLRPALRYFAVNAVFANFLQYDVGGTLAGLENPGLNPSLWTLKIEVGFYLILPLIWFAVRRLGLAVLAAIFAASAGYYAAMRGAGHYELAKQLPGQLQFFVLGIAAHAVPTRWRPGPVVSCAAMVALGVFITLLLRPHPAVLYPLAVGAFVVVTALLVPALRMRTDISYGVYLVHAPLIQLSLLLGVYQPGLIGLGLVLAVTIAVALAAERLVELPGIALGRRLTRRHSAALQPARP